MTNSKVVFQIFKSVSENFHPKITTIEETKNIDELKLSEFVSNFKTSKISHYQDKRGNVMALAS